MSIYLKSFVRRKWNQRWKINKIIEVMIEQIENNAYIPELNQLPKRIGYICKIIVTSWESYKRKKAAIMQY